MTTSRQISDAWATAAGVLAMLAIIAIAYVYYPVGGQTRSAAVLASGSVAK